MNEMMKSNGQNQDIRSIILSETMKAQFALAMPKCLTPDRLTRVALTALGKTPKLLNCSQQSLLSALFTCAELGLEPDGRRAHLIPYGNECKLIIDYKGLVELAMRSGRVANIHADVVCQDDIFEYDKGEVKTHKIDFRKERGEVYAAYSIVRFKDGTEKSEVLGLDEIIRIKERSQAGTRGPWVTDFNEMAKKTAFRRLSKWIQLSPEYHDALDRDYDIYPDLSRGDVTPSIPASHAATSIPESPVIPIADGKEEPPEPGSKSSLKDDIANLLFEGKKIIGDDRYAIIFAETFPDMSQSGSKLTKKQELDFLKKINSAVDELNG